MADVDENQKYKRRKTTDQYGAPLSPMSLAIAASLELAETVKADATEHGTETHEEEIVDNGLKTIDALEYMSSNETATEPTSQDNDNLGAAASADDPQATVQAPIWDAGYDFQALEPRLLFEASASVPLPAVDVLEGKHVTTRNNFFKGVVS